MHVFFSCDAVFVVYNHFLDELGQRVTAECIDEPKEPLRFPMLGLDISQTKIGLAIAERLDALPQPLYTYHRLTRARDLAQCQDWVQRYGIAGVVIGLPLNMDGTPGPRAQWMRRFSRELQERIAPPIFLQDERLSTVEAEEMLLAQAVRRDDRAARVDALAAALILQRFLAERHEEPC